MVQRPDYTEGTLGYLQSLNSSSERRGSEQVNVVKLFASMTRHSLHKFLSAVNSELCQPVRLIIAALDFAVPSSHGHKRLTKVLQ